MAGPDIDWLEVMKWGVPVVFYAGVTWGAYKSLTKKVDDNAEKIKEHEKRLNDMPGIIRDELLEVKHDIIREVYALHGVQYTGPARVIDRRHNPR